MKKNRYYILIPLMLGTLMAGLDSSIVNVSLPTMRRQFNVRVDEIEWVITAYMIAFCLFIPLINWLRTKIGYFNLYISSIVLFTVGSLLCSAAHSLTFLIIARIIQAIGGGAITPTAMAILSESFPKEERGRALGWWGMGTVLGPAMGPTLGGVLTQYFGWPSVFYINLPIGIITIWMSWRLLRSLRTARVVNAPFDTAGFIYFSLFIALFQFCLANIAHIGFHTWPLWVGFAVSGWSLYLFIRSGKKPYALLDLQVFRSRIFVNCILITIVRSIALFGGLFLLPFLLQGLMGFSEVQSGLLILPNSVMVLAVRPWAARLADRGEVRGISVLGLILIAVSMFLFSQANAGCSIWFIIIAMAIRGVGMGVLISPVSTALLNAVKQEQTATASSFYNLMQQLGGSVGIAIMGVMHQYIYTYYNDKYNHGAGGTNAVAEHFALQDGFLASAVLVAMAIIFAVRLPGHVENRKREENMVVPA